MAIKIENLTRLPLGYVGENGSRTISIDVTAWLNEYPDALIMIQVIRPEDHYKYPAAYTIQDGVLHWTVDAGELAYAGKGFAQISLYDPESKREYKSRVVGTIVSGSLEDFNDMQLAESDPANKWVNRVLDAADKAESAKESAAGSASKAAESVATFGRILDDEINAVKEEQKESVISESVRDLRRSFDKTTRFPPDIFINGTVTLSEESDNYGKVTKTVPYRIVTEDILCYPFDITLAATNHPYNFAVFRYDENDLFIGTDGYLRLEQRVKAGERFRVCINRSDVTSGTANINEYVNELQVLSGQEAPNTVVTDGAINAMMLLADEYFTWAYDPDGGTPLVYGGATEDNSHWYSGLSPVDVNNVPSKQYTINCSGFVNTMIQALPLSGSRYKNRLNNADAKNQTENWGYCYDSTARLGDFNEEHPTFYGKPTLNNNLGNIFTYDMLRYAEQHGFAYKINSDLSNVRPGDVLFESDYENHSERYRGIVHCALCVGVDKENRILLTIESAGATWTNPATGKSQAVGIRTIAPTAESFRYGARFPIGDVGCTPKIVSAWTAEDGGDVKLGRVERGIYTCVVKGNFQNRPRFRYTFDGKSEDWWTMVFSNKTTAVFIRYIPAAATIRVTAGAKNGIIDSSFAPESAILCRGYISPYADHSGLIEYFKTKQAVKQLNAGVATT